MQEAGAKTGQMALGVAEAVSEEIAVFNEGGGEATQIDKALGQAAEAGGKALRAGQHLLERSAAGAAGAAVGAAGAAAGAAH